MWTESMREGKPTKPERETNMKKGERIFNATRYECKKHIERWGYKVNPDGSAVGFNGLITEEPVCCRTKHASRTCIDKARKDVDRYLKIGVYTKERAEKEYNILNMVETSLNNQEV